MIELRSLDLNSFAMFSITIHSFAGFSWVLSIISSFHVWILYSDSLGLNKFDEYIILQKNVVHLPHGLEALPHDGFDECPIALVSVAIQSIDYNVDTLMKFKQFSKVNIISQLFSMVNSFWLKTKLSWIYF